VNKVFLTGKLKIAPDVAYTPRGGRILKFPLWVEDDGFSIDVVYLDRQGIRDFAGIMGTTVMVSGTLIKSKDRNGAFACKARKIIWMEE
jgi:hypothetical protein